MVVDICLLIEGGYPYVVGEVSNWLHSLLTNLPDLTFAIIHIGTVRPARYQACYCLPDNVVEFHEVFTHEIRHLREQPWKPVPSVVWQEFFRLHEVVAVGKLHHLGSVLPLIKEPGFARLTAAALLQGLESWDALVELYQLTAEQESFLDFFWTFRLTYLPLLVLLETMVPAAQIYHAINTGSSGLLGAVAKMRTGRPFLVTEHGLSTREREREIVQSVWLNEMKSHPQQIKKRMVFFQEWWLNIARFMEATTYELADRIISITAVNQQYQLRQGAAAHKLSYIPDGIERPRLLALQAGKETAGKLLRREGICTQKIPRVARLQPMAGSLEEPFTVGFVGRMVPGKDVKTLIRAIHISRQTIGSLQASLISPMRADRHYDQQCRLLVKLLNLEEVVHFLSSEEEGIGERKMEVLVLTSLSEVQPQVILEGMWAGIPIVATDVGACRELLYGVSSEDQALGACGIITPAFSPQCTADAIIKLWKNRSLRMRMGHIGRIRATHYYHREDMYRSYHTLYTSYHW